MKKVKKAVKKVSGLMSELSKGVENVQKLGGASKKFKVKKRK